MRQKFKDCLNRGKIILFPQGKHLVDKELNSDRIDLEDAEFGFAHSRYKWSTIQAYYSMYHSARALVFSKGYREKSHFCLYVALQELFVDQGSIEVDLAEFFLASMRMREGADYRDSFSQEGALLVIDKAGQFLTKAEEILSLA
jgi:uncharacterized protein (UPF0332 family)